MLKYTIFLSIFLVSCNPEQEQRIEHIGERIVDDAIDEAEVELVELEELKHGN